MKGKPGEKESAGKQPENGAAAAPGAAGVSQSAEPAGEETQPEAGGEPEAGEGAQPEAGGEPEAGEQAQPEAGEETQPEAGESSSSSEAPGQSDGSARGGIKALGARVMGAMQDRGQLRAKIAGLEAENAKLRAQLAEALPLAQAHQELEQQVEALEKQKQTVESGVQAQLEAVGIPAAEAPEVSDAIGGESIGDLVKQLDSEKDPAERSRIYKQIRELEKKG